MVYLPFLHCCSNASSMVQTTTLQLSILTPKQGVSLLRFMGVNLLRRTGVSFKRFWGVSFTVFSTLFQKQWWNERLSAGSQKKRIFDVQRIWPKTLHLLKNILLVPPFCVNVMEIYIIWFENWIVPIFPENECEFKFELKRHWTGHSGAILDIALLNNQIGSKSAALQSPWLLEKALLWQST